MDLTTLRWQALAPMNQPPLVVIMDDETKIRTKFRDQLKKGHLQAHVAVSLKRLMMLLEKDHYDASILDIRMSQGGNEGLAAIEQLRKKYPEMYIEVHTGYVEYKQPAYDKGADQVFIKPDGYGPDAPDRIKQSILQKRLNILANKMALLAAVVEKDLPQPDEKFEIGQKLAGFEIKIDTLLDCVKLLSSFLVSNAQKYGISNTMINELKRNAARAMLPAALQASFQAERAGDDLEILVSPTLAKDRNYQAYLRLQKDLETNHMNHYIAIVDGEFECAEATLNELNEALNRTPERNKAFIKKVTRSEQNRMVDLGRFSRVIKV